MARAKKKRSRVYVISVVAHLAAGAVLALIPQEKLREVVAIALNETREEKKPEPPKPPPHAPEAQPRTVAHAERPMPAATPAAATAAAADSPGFADIGLALDSNSSDGIAVNIAPPPAMARPEPVIPVRPKVLVPHHVEATCSEDLVKARPLAIVRPAYTDRAREARVQGRLVIELMLDERGEITAAKIVKGLGFGLDEAALEAARRLHFSPATRCNRPVAGPFVLGMRFALPQ